MQGPKGLPWSAVLEVLSLTVRVTELTRHFLKHWEISPNQRTSRMLVHFLVLLTETGTSQMRFCNFCCHSNPCWRKESFFSGCLSMRKLSTKPKSIWAQQRIWTSTICPLHLGCKSMHLVCSNPVLSWSKKPVSGRPFRLEVIFWVKLKLDMQWLS